MVVATIVFGLASLLLLWLAVEFEYKHNIVKYLLAASHAVMLIIFVCCAIKFWTAFSPFEMATFALIYAGLVVDSKAEKMNEIQIERQEYVIAILMGTVVITLVFGIFTVCLYLTTK